MYAQTTPVPVQPAPIRVATQPAPIKVTTQPAAVPVVPVTPAPVATPAAPVGDAKAQAQILVDKAKELFQSDKLEQAKASNDAALKLAPDLLAAKILDQLIKSRMAGPATQTAATQGAGGGVAVETPGGTDAGGLQDKLTAAQINRIRAYETTNADTRLQGTVDQKTLADFWKEVILNDPTKRNLEAKDKEAFFNGPFVNQVLLFKESKRNDYIDRLKITSDPVAMEKFKEVNTWVVNSCTYQAGCHSADNSMEKFRIYTRGGLTPANVYTNFLIMSKVTVGNSLLIDRQRPDSSVLAQFGLPAKDAVQTHPATKVRIAQRFTGLKDPGYTKVTDAIGALERIEHNYGFSTSSATSQPAPK
jgi:hypothetical protein